MDDYINAHLNINMSASDSALNWTQRTIHDLVGTPELCFTNDPI